MPLSRGTLYATLSATWWGLAPLYWKLLAHVSASEVLAQRVVWACLFTFLLVIPREGIASLARTISSARTFLLVLVSGVLIGVNWFLFIWAVGNGFVLQSSLGYYINPLVGVLLGCVVLGERLRPVQRVALLLAGAGVANLTLAYGAVPWISIGLATTFAFYGLVRKVAPLGALQGLTLETAILTPLALWYLGTCPGYGLAHDGSTLMLLAGTGVMTSVPLLWFVGASRQLSLSVLGFFQFIAPSLHFLLAVLWFDEPFTLHHGVTFALIWSGLLLLTWSGWRHRQPSVPPGPYPASRRDQVEQDNQSP